MSKISYHDLGVNFCRESFPKKFSNPKVLIFNEQLSDDLGLGIDEADISLVFSGQKKISDTNFYSLAYSGHQFGQFNPTLGDGRAILIGELNTPDNEWLDIQLKGAGPTEFSRRGDGLCALGPAIREYIVSETMYKFNICTTRSLSVVMTNEKVMREEILSGGIITRVAKSHLRVGSFQYFLYQKDLSGMQKLFEYTLKRLYPEILKVDIENRPFEFLKQVIKRQVNLVSDWMSVGFIHGVMNTDNTSISGETIDYGPCAFMDQFNFQQVYSYIDRNGRYAFSEQPKILFWNMARLADCLIPIINMPDDKAVEKLNEILQTIPDLFQEVFTLKMCKKLGAENLIKDDQEELISQYFAYLQKAELDFTLANRFFAREMVGANERPDLFLKSTDYFELLKFYQSKVDLKKIDFLKLDELNPIYIPRNHLIEKVIEDAYQNKFQSLEEILDILSDPFKERVEAKFDKYLRPPTGAEKIKNTFCGT